MILNLSDVSSEPLHSQISRQIRAKVLAEELKSDHALPSIRALARQQRVSVITVQRAYEDLEREGLIRARRGKGFFVAPISDARRQSMAERRLSDSLTPLLREAFAEGLTSSQILSIFQRCLDREGGSK